VVSGEKAPAEPIWCPQHGLQCQLGFLGYNLALAGWITA
jgi:hypothetical protein